MTQKNHFGFYAILLFFWAVLLRLPTFGNPILDFDESWYLYAGGQFLQGYLPYIGIWDRKPFGLFLLYAPFHFFGQYRFLAYQITALIFAWGTALLILKMAQRFTSALAGCLGGMLYLALLMPLSGFGGQSPVFYNLLTALAFSLVIYRFDEFKSAESAPETLRKTGFQAMFLFGMAIEIKPCVVFEGIFLGCFLLLTCWQTQKNPKSLCLNSFFWILSALLPSLAIIALYAWLGHFQEWYFANILSIFIRHATAWSPKIFLLFGLLAAFLFTLSVIFLREYSDFSAAKKAFFPFVLFWCIASFAGICLVPPYFSHYFLPFALPFSLLTCFTVSQRRLGRTLLAIAIFAVAVLGEKIFFYLGSLHPQEEYYEIQKHLLQRPDGCLFEYGASVTLLDTTSFALNRCHLTAYAFPAHLGSSGDTGALGVDEIAELRNILAQNPAFILIGEKYFDFFEDNPEGLPKSSLFAEKNRLMRTELKENYHLVYTHKASETLELYERNSAALLSK